MGLLFMSIEMEIRRWTFGSFASGRAMARRFPGSVKKDWVCEIVSTRSVAQQLLERVHLSRGNIKKANIQD